MICAVEEGQYIIRQGEVGEGIYFIWKGEVGLLHN